MEGPFKADINFLTTYIIVQCNIRDDDDAMLFKLKWSLHLK